jgi:hypothetical protein
MAETKQWSKPPELQIDLKKKYTATFKTDKGDIICELFALKVPAKASMTTPSSTA